jgi:hypothetical protein
VENTALIPDAGNEMDSAKSQEFASGWVELISEASYGYMKQVEGRRFERSPLA